MPNTLAHLGVQTCLSRAAIRGADLRWVFVGCVVPDLPWIANRVTAAVLPGAAALEIAPYWIAQASWAGTLPMCAALAVLAARPGRAFALLAGNAFIHLLLDALEIKWGNGVHLWAPFSWHAWSAGWFWPDSWPVLVLTALGAAATVFALREVRRHAAHLARPRREAWIWSAALLAVYLVFPWFARDAVVAADAHGLQTLARPELRPGREAAFDRVWLERGADGARLHALGGVVLRAAGAVPARSAIVSARGRFSDRHTIVLTDVHVQRFPRDAASYAGLAAIAAVLIAGWVPRGAPSDPT